MSLNKRHILKDEKRDELYIKKFCPFVRLVLRMFYDHIKVIIVDALLQCLNGTHWARNGITEAQLVTATNLSAKQVSQNLSQLLEHNLVTHIQRNIKKERDRYQKRPKTGSTDDAWIIDVASFLNVVEFRKRKMVEKLSPSGDELGLKYICPNANNPDTPCPLGAQEFPIIELISSNQSSAWSCAVCVDHNRVPLSLRKTQASIDMMSGGMQDLLKTFNEQMVPLEGWIKVASEAVARLQEDDKLRGQREIADQRRGFSFQSDSSRQGSAGLLGGTDDDEDSEGEDSRATLKHKKRKKLLVPLPWDENQDEAIQQARLASEEEERRLARAASERKQRNEAKGVFDQVYGTEYPRMYAQLLDQHFSLANLAKTQKSSTEPTSGKMSYSTLPRPSDHAKAELSTRLSESSDTFTALSIKTEGLTEDEEAVEVRGELRRLSEVTQNDADLMTQEEFQAYRQAMANRTPWFY